MVRGKASGFAQTIVAGTHTLVGDEPVTAGGTDTGPSPYEFLLSALGTCTSMTVAMYARRKQWPLEEVAVTLAHSRIPAAECADCETKEGMVDQILCDLELIGPLDAEQRARLREIADRCPVHRTLRSEIRIATTLV
jgi:putative redox protein